MTGREKLSCRGLTLFETIIVCLVVSTLILVVFRQYKKMEDRARRNAMSMELTNMRLAIRLYRMINNRYPSSLRELVREKYYFPDDRKPASGAVEGAPSSDFFERKYLEAQAFDEMGCPIDPYGRRFEYDPYSGRVEPAGDFPR